MAMKNSNNSSADARSTAVVRNYTLLAMGTGAVPLPAATAAIVTENAVMIGHIGAVYGVAVTAETVIASLGAVAVLNMGGRALFIEGMRALNALGGGLATVAVSALGATTAGVQTWMIGHLAIAIAKNGGQPVDPGTSQRVMEDARESFDPEELRRTGAPAVEGNRTRSR